MPPPRLAERRAGLRVALTSRTGASDTVPDGVRTPRCSRARALAASRWAGENRAAALSSSRDCRERTGGGLALTRCAAARLVVCRSSRSAPKISSPTLAASCHGLDVCRVPKTSWKTGFTRRCRRHVSADGYQGRRVPAAGCLATGGRLTARGPHDGFVVGPVLTAGQRRACHHWRRPSGSCLRGT